MPTSSSFYYNGAATKILVNGQFELDNKSWTRKNWDLIFFLFESKYVGYEDELAKNVFIF